MSTNGQVVHVDDEPSFPNVVSKVKVHECLKSRQRATKAEEHHRWFEQSKRCDEGSLPFITLLNLNVIISPPYIELGKERELAKVVDEIGDEGQGVCVLYCMFIEISVVLNWSKLSILLFDKKEERGLWGFGWSDLSCFQVFIDECLAGC